MRVALAQINSTVGDIDGNTTRILAEIERSRSGGAEIVVFPELAVFGYPPKDLVLRQDLVHRNMVAVERIASRCTDIAAIVADEAFVWLDAPIKRVSAPDVPPPFAPVLEREYVPNEEKIVAAVQSLL